jgi:hypothetical protein
MQDDSPWKPPADAGRDDDTASAAESSVVPPPPPVAGSAPILPSPSGDASAALPPPRGASPAPTLPAPSGNGAPSAWAPGGAADQISPTPEIPSAPVSPPPPADIGAPVAGTVGADVAPPTTVVETSPDRPGRSKWLVAGAVAAVIAVVASGVFAIVNLTGSTADEGGAVSPEELGADLLAALENEDVLGAIDLFLPGERESVGEPFIEVVSELQRLEVLGETDLSQLSGIDVELTDETVVAESTNVSDIVNVQLGADVVVSFDGAELPIGDLITDNLPEDVVTELRGTRTTETDRLDGWLTAVSEDGRWYFSLFHTAAEVVRADAAPELLVPAQGIGTVGADSPESAVDQLFANVESLDVRGIIQGFNPAEAAALQRYAPLFIEDAEAAVAEIPFSWQITDREVRIEGDGDRRTAFVDAISIEGVADGAAFSISVADGCLAASAEGESIDVCPSDVGRDQLDEVFSEWPEVIRVIDTVESAFADMEPSGLELREYDGEWFVSPLGTGSEAILNVFRALDRQELDDIIAAVQDAIDSFGDDLFGAIDDLAAGGLDGSFDDSFGDGFDDSIEIVDPDGDTATGEPSWFDCYEETDTDAALACFESFVASGDIDRAQIPAVLRFPECGYADLAWTNEVYGLSDEKFVAAVAPARDCFLDLVDQGLVEEYELPNEIAHYECFEDRNWYQVFDDPDYDERYYACLDGSG